MYRLRIKILLATVVLLAAALIIILGSNVLTLKRYFMPKKPEAEDVAMVKYFPFSSQDSLKEWEEKVLHKRVDYAVESTGEESYVRARSVRSCSAMYYKMKLDAKKRPIISWKWRVKDFPSKGSKDNLLSREEDDFAARMYVIFPALFFSGSKVIEYIWARDLEIGTISSSPYSDNIKLIVAEAGPSEGDEWIFEERDIYEDYTAAFNTAPKLKIGAIAFMCDSDSTRSSAEAFFDEIKIFHNR